MLPETQLRCSTVHGVMSVLARSTVAEPLAVCSARVLRGSPWPRDAGGTKAPDYECCGHVHPGRPRGRSAPRSARRCGRRCRLWSGERTATCCRIGQRGARGATCRPCVARPGGDGAARGAQQAGGDTHLRQVERSPVARDHRPLVRATAVALPSCMSMHGQVHM
jgi:hypothetical protein